MGLITVLASYGYYYGGAIGDVLNKWAELGFFDYILPFLLIFALIYGILSSMKLFRENRVIDAIIALAIGLLALQFPMVSIFFSELFPRTAIGLAILLVLLIVAGFFVDTSKPGIMYTLLGVGVIIALVIFVSTSEAVSPYTGYGYWFFENWPLIALGVFVIVVIAAIVGVRTKTPQTYTLGPWRTETPS